MFGFKRFFPSKLSVVELKEKTRAAVPKDYQELASHIPEHLREGSLSACKIQAFAAAAEEVQCDAFVVRNSNNSQWLSPEKKTKVSKENNTTPEDAARSLDRFFEDIAPHAEGLP